MSDEQHSEPPADAGSASGADLARAALARAKEQAKARGLTTGARPAIRRVRPLRPASDDSRDPTPFGAAIGDLMAERGWQHSAKAASVVGRWEQIVGPDIAAHSRPESLRDGELVLVAESTAWATQLRLLVPTMLSRITDELGPGVVTAIRVHGPTAPNWQRGPRRISGGRGPRDTYG